MDFTNTSEDIYVIQKELLGLLIDEYNKRSTRVLHAQRMLLQRDMADLRMELAMAHGAAECLHIIYKHSPKDIQDDITIRTGLFRTIPGTGGERSQGEERSGQSSGESSSGKSWL